mgnify:CR=1 FL=1
MASARKLHTTKYKLYNSSNWITINWNHVEYITQFKLEDEVVGSTIYFNSGNSVSIKDNFSSVEHDMKFGK